MASGNLDLKVVKQAQLVTVKLPSLKKAVVTENPKKGAACISDIKKNKAQGKSTENSVGGSRKESISKKYYGPKDIVRSRQWTSKKYSRPISTTTNVQDANMGSTIDRKIFVGGLHKSTTPRSLRKYFSSFGDIRRVELKMHSDGTSRCFGFIVFREKATVARVLAVSSHVIDNKVVDTNRALPRSAKIYIGGLKHELSAETIHKHFCFFGKIVDVELPYDYEHNCRKEFAFVTYENQNDAKRAVMQSEHLIGDTPVAVNWATPKPVLLRKRGLVPGAYPFQGQYKAAERLFKFQNLYNDLAQLHIYRGRNAFLNN